MKRILRRARLGYTAGKSDKVYEVDLAQDGHLCDVVYRYGRRGAGLAEGSKITGATRAGADECFEKLVAQKITKGYVEEGEQLLSEPIVDPLRCRITKAVDDRVAEVHRLRGIRTDRKVKVFCSYAHADEALRGELEVHLSPLRRDGMIQVWHDASINPGQQLASVIKRELAAAEVILLLVSPAFIASDYCWEIEMKEAIRRHRAGTATALPVILRPADWSTAPFRPLLAVPRDGVPVTQWSDRDAAWTDVVLGIRRAVEERLGTAPSTPRPTVKDSI